MINGMLSSQLAAHSYMTWTCGSTMIAKVEIVPRVAIL